MANAIQHTLPVAFQRNAIRTRLRIALRTAETLPALREHVVELLSELGTQPGLYTPQAPDADDAPPTMRSVPSFDTGADSDAAPSVPVTEDGAGP